MEILELLLISTFLTLIPGQLVRIPLFSSSGAITLTDILVLTTDLFFLIYAFSIKKSLKIHYKIFFPALLFCLSALASTILAIGKFSSAQILVSSFFLVRFVLYFFLSVVVYNVVQKKHILNWLNLILFVGFLFIILGFIQLLIFPDLSFLVVFGWDPHQTRIVSTLLDPNFAGLIFVLLFTISISRYLFWEKGHLGLIFLVMAILSFLALIFTFSRSSYIAFLVSATIIGIVKSPKILISVLVLFLVAFLTIGQVRGRIIGAFTLDETARARIISWQNALVIFKDNSFFGVGFDTYRFAQANYGFFSFDDPEGGHSGSGVDSSLLLVLVTTGIIGFGFYLFLLLALFQEFKNKVKINVVHLASTSFFVGLIVHSQFVNSLFFPQIMLILWFMLGLVHVDDTL